MSEIIRSIGEDGFKSEACIDAFLKDEDQMYNANIKTTGGYISGEVKLGIVIRLLTGGASYDFSVMYDVAYENRNRILHEVLLK